MSRVAHESSLRILRHIHPKGLVARLELAALIRWHRRAMRSLND